MKQSQINDFVQIWPNHVDGDRPCGTTFSKIWLTSTITDVTASSEANADQSMTTATTDSSFPLLSSLVPTIIATAATTTFFVDSYSNECYLLPYLASALTASIPLLCQNRQRI